MDWWHSFSQAMHHSSWGILGKNQFKKKKKASEEATWKEGMIGWEIEDFLIRLGIVF